LPEILIFMPFKIYTPEIHFIITGQIRMEACCDVNAIISIAQY